MEPVSTSIVQDLTLLRTLIGIVRDNESQTSELTGSAFADHILKKLRDKNHKTKLINSEEKVTLLDNMAAILFISDNNNVYDEKSHMIALLKKHNIKIGYVVNNAKYPQVNIARFIA